MMHERDSDGAEVPDAKRSRVHVENGAPDGIDPIGQPVLEEAAVPVQTEFAEGDLPAVPSSLTGSSNLFISTIPHDYTEHSLTAMFAPYGDIDSVRVMRDSATGSSRGFGFVKFRTHEMAQDAINVLNGRRLNNRPLTVKLAEMPASSNPLKMALGSSAKNENIYIKNLPPSINDEQLKLVFQSCGRILSTRVLFDKMTGQPRGAAMLRYESIDAADRAIQELSGQVFPGGTERMVIKYADSEQEKEKKKARRVASMTAPSPGMSKPPPAVIPPVRATPVISPKPLPVVIPPPHKLQQMQQMQQPQQSYLQPATAQYQLPAQPAGVQQPYYTSDAMFYQEPTPPPPQLDMGLQYGQPQAQYAQAQPQYTQPQPQYGGVPQYGAPQQMQYGGGYGGQQPAPPPPPPPPQQQQYMQPMQPIQQIQSPLQQAQMPQQNQNADMTNLYIANLPHEADDALLSRLFSPFGPITSVRAMIDVVTGQCKGIGFVRFGNWQSASNAARMMNGSQIGSKTISVSFKK